MGNFFSDIWNDITGKTQAKMQKQTQEAALSATDRQAAFEREQIDRRNRMQDPMYAQAQAEAMNALPKAQSTLNAYSKYLKYAPDTIYNQERSTMERGISDAANQTSRMMRQRGLGRSGLAGTALGDLAVKRAGMLGNLEAGREERRGANLATQTQLWQGWLDKWLNQQNSVAQLAQVQGTQVPQMQMQYAQMMQNQANQPSPLGQMAGNLAGAWINKQFAPPTTVPTGQQSAGGQSTGSNPFMAFLNPSTYSSGGNLLGTVAKFFL